MIVIDCSILMAVLLPDEQHPFALNIFEQARENQQELLIPSFLYIEANNVLLMASRRKRIEENKLNDYLKRISNLPVVVDNAAFLPKKQTELTRFAQKNGLSIYDAVYLELAMRKNCPLATLDKSLRHAAEMSGLLYKVNP